MERDGTSVFECTSIYETPQYTAQMESNDCEVYLKNVMAVTVVTGATSNL